MEIKNRPQIAYHNETSPLFSTHSMSFVRQNILNYELLLRHFATGSIVKTPSSDKKSKLM